MTPIITTLIVIAIIVAAIAGGVFFIKYKLNKVTRKHLGMGLGQTANLLKNGIKEEASAPKPISNLTAALMPSLLRDFPDTSAQQIEEMARNALTGFLTAVTLQDPDKLFAASRNLSQQAADRIAAGLAANAPEKFEDVKLHKTGLSAYKSANGTADATFQISFQALHGGKQPEQMKAIVVLNSGRAEAEEGSSAVFSMNCPNCGAPLKIAGKDSFCQYCGTGVTPKGTRVWLADSVKLV